MDAGDGPVLEVVELVAGEVGDFVVSEGSFEAALGGLEDLGVVAGVFGLGHLFDNAGKDVLLVFAALFVAGAVEFAFAGELEGAFAIDVVGASIVVAAAGIKCPLGIDIDAAHGVDDFDDGMEADLDGVVDLDIEEIFDGGFAHLDAIHTGVGELVFNAGGAVKLDVGVARNVDEENFGVAWIDDSDNINVAAGAVGNLAAWSIGARNINNEWLGGDIDGAAKIWGLGADFEFEDDASVVGKGSFALLCEIIDIAVAKDNGRNLGVI